VTTIIFLLLKLLLFLDRISIAEELTNTPKELIVFVDDGDGVCSKCGKSEGELLLRVSVVFEDSMSDNLRWAGLNGDISIEMLKYD